MKQNLHTDVLIGRDSIGMVQAISIRLFKDADIRRADILYVRITALHGQRKGMNAIFDLHL